MEYKIVDTGVKELMFVPLPEEPETMWRTTVNDFIQSKQTAEKNFKFLFLLGKEKESDIIPLLKKDDRTDGLLYLRPNSAVNMGGWQTENGQVGLVRTEFYQAMTCWELFLNDQEIRIIAPPTLPPPPIDADEQSTKWYNEYKVSHEKRVARYTELKHLNEKHWIVLEVSEGAGPAASDNSPQNSNHEDN